MNKISVYTLENDVEMKVTGLVYSRSKVYLIRNSIDFNNMNYKFSIW